MQKSSLRLVVPTPINGQLRLVASRTAKRETGCTEAEVARAGLGEAVGAPGARRNPSISFQLICLEPRLTNQASLRWEYWQCGSIHGQG